MNAKRKPWEPVCALCGIDTPAFNTYLTPANYPDMPGVGLFVCSPSCPERGNRAVYQHPRWWERG